MMAQREGEAQGGSALLCSLGARGAGQGWFGQEGSLQQECGPAGQASGWLQAPGLKSGVQKDVHRPGRRLLLLLLLCPRGLVPAPARIWEYLAAYSHGSSPLIELCCRLKSLK